MRRKAGKDHAIARWILAAVYLAVGIFHLSRPDLLLPIMPDWVPWPREVILVTGICEILGAIALFNPTLRRAAGFALAIYAICVYPANIKDAIHNLPLGGWRVNWWYHAPRLAFQPVFVWWALYAAEIVDWPFATASRRPRINRRPHIKL